MINIEDYFEKYANLTHFEKGDSEYLIDREDFKAAVKEIVEAVIDKCAEEAETILVDNISKTKEFYPHGQAPSGYDLGTEVDRESILNVKNQINY